MIKQNKKLVRFIFEQAKSQSTNNCVTRHQCTNSKDFDEFDKVENIKSTPIFLPEAITCYGCSKIIKKVHGNYVYSCVACGTIFQQNRYLSTPQIDKVAVVTGARTKLGHQVCLKLLRAGAVVFGTTRFPEKAQEIFKLYSDYDTWKHRLFIYPLDLDIVEMEEEFCKLRDAITGSSFTKVDILINCAAQTIRHREKMTDDDRLKCEEKNRYGDGKFVEKNAVNSWNMMLPDLLQTEMEELFRINSIAPVLLTKTLLPLLKKSDRAFIINVHAKEGLFDTHKSPKHMHTNMAKSALCMFTRVLIEHNYVSEKTGKKFSIHGCDPGWISVDEYELSGSPWITPPLDEVDGAARILYPLWMNRASNVKTRRQFEQFRF
jgi:NAD(P)-dependent dehydrogenase (short-subunit alcohol dehydrogenase family)